MRAAYVYYRVDPARAGEADARISALLNAMTPYCAFAPRCMARCDDPQTWMEIYEGIADWAAFLDALDTQVNARHLDACITGERHLECFQMP